VTQRPRRAQLEAAIRRYYDGCNRADRAMMISTMAPHAAHYFPGGAPQGPFLGAEAIAEGWIEAVRRLDSRWTIDRLVVDEQRDEAVVEWTHFKPNQGVLLRGAEWICFDTDGRITEIRAYYACPPPGGQPQTHSLGGFDYAERGYPLTPPSVDREDQPA
jgi:hypothetical protein